MAFLLVREVRMRRAVEKVLSSQPPQADAATLQLAWAAEKERFLSALVDEAAEARSTADLWRVFLDEWQAVAVRVAPTRFRDALIQAPVIVVGELLEFDEQHIAATLAQVPAE